MVDSCKAIHQILPECRYLSYTFSMNFLNELSELELNISIIRTELNIIRTEVKHQQWHSEIISLLCRIRNYDPSFYSLLYGEIRVLNTQYFCKLLGKLSRVALDFSPFKIRKFIDILICYLGWFMVGGKEPNYGVRNSHYYFRKTCFYVLPY